MPKHIMIFTDDPDAPFDSSKVNVKTPPGVSPKREEKPSPSVSACEGRLCSSLCYEYDEALHS